MSYATRAMECGGHAPGMGRIEMPQYALWTRSEITQQTTMTNRQIQATTGAVNTNRSRLVALGTAGNQLYTEWMQFKQQWQQFYGGSSSSWLGASQSTVRTFVDRYNALEARLVQAGIPIVQQSEDTRAAPGSVFGGGAFSLNTYLMVGAGVVGLVALAVLGTAVAATVRSPAASAAARLARNRRRR